MAATNSLFRTETGDEHLYNHIELFNRSSSPIDATAANLFKDCREQQPTGNQIATGQRMFGDYRTEPNNEHLYNNIQSINKPSSPATESQAGNQTSQDDRRGQQPTGNSKTMDRRVLYAVIAVLALAFLAMIASLIARTWVQAAQSGTNGCQLNQVKKEITQLVENLGKEKKTETPGLPEKKIGSNTTHEGCQQQLNKVLKNLDDAVEIINKGQDILQEIQNLKNEIEDSKEKETIKFEQAIRNQILELKQEIKVFIENQTNNLTSEFEDLAARVNQVDEDPWIKINKPPICFDHNRKQLKRCLIVPSSGTLVAVKLVHAYGYVVCNHTHWTFWGCGENIDVNFKKGKATSDVGHSTRFSTTKGERKGSWIPGYSTHSRELVLSYASNPQHVTGGQALCLSYLEGTSAENEGKSCCDVYARITYM